MDKTQSLISSAGTPEKSPAKCSRRRHRYLKSVTGVVAGIIVLNAAVSLLLAEWRQPVMVSFDMAGTVNSFMSQAAAQALDEARVKALTARFNRALSDSLTAYQREHRAVIIVAPAVVGGAEDITADIQQAVAARMAEGT
ncbi:type-F conjugative transfer system protein TrbI [Salmonella enterica subsp. enterica serovar Give]|uniref:type-F conjugative transfer system protein TrbI n=1 Tax=Salmonella enterica TaxID=28901 RepID=UPI000729B0C7|nr:type-F conjugative transfer system protein TrbI [Salmonella enterica]ECI2792481.1 type-F conjugative transfer system protein TrbI [Salmonella enterica subsp. enterica serovar Give]EEA7255400.1 type-F conjugative transfer system protein TrbI [Salmonella enterica subsp. enterica]EGZ3891180.1 type-F conjugative transfer system protein TrbI [Salmonella enterica subsp. enterica serovar Bonn]EHA9278316.1 type-F conjugative transfer system protein TrbI [Salmonella enterica subsp. enterica serovar S